MAEPLHSKEKVNRVRSKSLREFEFSRADDHNLQESRLRNYKFFQKIDFSFSVSGPPINCCSCGQVTVLRI